MNELHYREIAYTFRDKETVLETLLRHGVEINHSCKNGVCNACLCKAEQPSDALYSAPLPTDLLEKGYFLPCKTQAFDGLRFGPQHVADITVKAAVAEKSFLTPDILKLLLEPHSVMHYQAGQFIHLFHPDGDYRPYSIASTLHDSPYIELHIRVTPQGKFGSWLANEIEAGSEIRISQAMGDSFLKPKMDDLHLFAFGVGLSAIGGITHEAIYQNQAGKNRKIHLTHIARRAEDLYLHAQLSALAEMNPGLSVRCLTETGFEQPFFFALAQAVISDRTSERPPHVFICGSPDSVKALQSALMTHGFNALNIVCDPFEHYSEDNHSTDAPSVTGSSTTTEALETIAKEEKKWPTSCLPLWQILQANGDLLKTIIDDFYDIVFEDEIMSPYFQNFTKQRSKEKVYSFYKQLFSGEKCYFGDRPRNAHHWMVIPDEIYDHRLDLLQSVMYKHQLPAEAIALWLPYEEYYRSEIVKKSPQGRKVGDVYQPAGGFDYETLDEGSICDSCQEFVDKGTRVMFHLRTGQIYCPTCHSEKEIEKIEP